MARAPIDALKLNVYIDSFIHSHHNFSLSFQGHESICEAVKESLGLPRLFCPLTSQSRLALSILVI